MVVHITIIPTPYRVSLYSLISEKLARSNVEFHVIFATQTYRRRRWENCLQDAQFDYTVMNFPYIRFGYEKIYSIPVGLSKRIEQLDPSCLILSGFNLLTVAGSLWASRHNIHYIIWSGETVREFNQRRGKVLFKYLRRKTARNAAAFIAYGTEAKRYLEALGARREKITVAINCVDTDFFKNRVSSLRSNTKALKEDKTSRILYVGHLQHRKGLEFVLKAMAQINANHVTLDVVGDGPENRYYKELTHSLGLRNVHFWGFKQKTELPQFYANADIFVFPSVWELYGLVAVEAASAGLPIIASKFAGATCDLVKDGKNGFILDPRNVSELARRIEELCLDKEKREKMGKYSLKIIDESVNIHKSAEGVVQAIMNCYNQRQYQ